MTLAGRYQEKLINSGYYTIDTSINMVTAGLGINLIGLDKKINKISGGQCAKVILASNRNFQRPLRFLPTILRRVKLSSLTLVSLPIGNLGDNTLRALEALKSGQCFYAEDTRVFKKLLDSLGILYAGKFIDSFHDHSEGKIQVIVEKIQQGIEVYS